MESNRSKTNKMNIEVLCKSALLARLETGLDPDTVVISYYDSDDEPIDFEQYAKKPDAYISKCIDDYEYFEDTYDDDFKEIVRFILNNKDKNFICQCHFGMRRSAATAMAIDEFFNHKGMKYYIDDRFNPNREVFKKIYNGLKQATR